MFAAAFLLMLTGHYLADYPLQTDHQAKHKAQCGAHGWKANAAHAGTHAAVMAVLLAVGSLLLPELAGLSIGSILAAVAWVGVTHSVIDRRWPVQKWMAFARQAKFAQHGGAAHVDQTAHITVIATAALALAALS